jgi:hypothetical protein
MSDSQWGIFVQELSSVNWHEDFSGIFRLFFSRRFKKFLQFFKDKMASNQTRGRKLLYVDLLNIQSYFFPMKVVPKDIPNKLKKVKRFFFASRNSGYTLKLFIDSVRISDEAVKKFMSRREKAIISEKQTMINGAETF